MVIDKYFKGDSIRDLLKHAGILLGILAFFCIIYFYVYLPSTTNHGEMVEVPDLKGIKIDELGKFLKDHKLRFELNDSSYSDSLPPLTVTRQFPAVGAKVKENRIIFVSLNRVAPPTLPMPDLTGSYDNAKAVLKSSELKLGRVWYQASPFKNWVTEFRYKGKPVEPGTRLTKGSVIDLIIGDGNGPADFVIGNLVGDSYEIAMEKLAGWNLHLGKVELAEGADTTGVKPFVFKQEPQVGDSVRVGDPVNIWLAEKGYKPEEKEDEGNP
ncbi:MAG TPA: PASTA domain-containing protein [Cyclobacteriaceae bacterium]|nr:PASTA domain-containing protein [Cyclobacteriaceae bacterium]